MLTASPGMKILPSCTVQFSQALVNIFNCMGMNKVHNYDDTHSMSLVDQLFQFIRISEP